MRGKGFWKKPSDVKKLTFSENRTGELIRIGGMYFGNVYVGRVRFNDGTVHRVAIKKFKDPLTDSAAKKYQLVIHRLRKAGIGLPKMGMVKLHGNWVMVSQLFGSVKRGSKFSEKSMIKTQKERIEAIKILTKVANAGFYPHADIIEPLKAPARGVVPIDLDWPARHENFSADSQAHSLTSVINALGASPKNETMLLEVAMKTANPKLKAALEKYRRYYR